MSMQHGSPIAQILGILCAPRTGVVDAMRIGADVTPSWTSLLGRTVGRNRHGLATFHALLNTLTRSVLDGAWFLNDPDCLMVRDTDTKLTEDEVRDFCRDQIAHYKVPRYIRFVDDMPMTITGKVQKFVMREKMMAELKLQEAKTA